jgi:DNA-binding response OmpR family regulator
MVLPKKTPAILIAEDDPGIRLTLELVLQEEGLDVHFAENGQQAIDLAKSLNPQVMVVDYMMPEKDGRTVVQELKASAATSGIPIVILSGVARGEEQDWQGAHFLGKPFSPDELIDRIRALLDTK